MATPTYTLIDSVTLGSAASSVTFSSIPAGGDAVLVADCTPTGGASILFTVNSDSGSNYNYVYMRGNGSSATSATASSGTTGNLGYLDAKSLITMSFQDYSATDKHKSILSRTNTGGYVFANANRWASTAAITAFSLTLSGGESFAIGSTFNLFQLVSE
tara:strand:+ start:447 stop:923 length:477 start_codon:yes stop_codon:yes gene_type:complete